MFYSETYGPISNFFVKRLFGVNAETDPKRAAAIGVYPLQEVDAGFDVDKFVKVSNRYIAIPELSETELALILDVRDNYE